MELLKKNITRRRFVKNVAGVTLCCACLPLKVMASPEKISTYTTKDNESKVHLAAACGTYCGACPAYLNKHDEGENNFPTEQVNDNIDAFVNMMEQLQCDGCLSGRTLAGHCRSCSIRLCVAGKQEDSRCSDCEELPCYRITNLINQGDYPHRDEYLPNLAKISEMGVEDWILYEEDRWSCVHCDQTLSWYDTRCTGCGAPRPEAVFALFEDELPDRKDLTPILNLLLDYLFLY